MQSDIAGSTIASALNKLLGIQLWNKDATQKSYLKAFMNDDSAYPNTKCTFVFPTLRTAASRKTFFFCLLNNTYTTPPYQCQLTILRMTSTRNVKLTKIFPA